MDTASDRSRKFALGKPAGAADFILERRYRLVCKYAPSLGGDLLDYGCGNGSNTMLFRDDFKSIVGVDVVAEHIEEFRRMLPPESAGCNLDPVLYDGDILPLNDESMDAVISFEVLEHVSDEQASLAELLRVLRPGGWMAMTVPNRWWVFETHGADLPLLPWNRVPFFSWLPKPLHDRWARARIYRRREIITLVRDAGFDVDFARYVMAPLDVLKWKPIRDMLRRTFFRNDLAAIPVQATAVLIIARKPHATP